LDVPVLLVDQTLQALFKDPAAFEAKLSGLTGRSSGLSGTAADGSFYFSRLFKLVNNIDPSGKHSTPNAGIGIVGESFKHSGPNTVISEPDITYDVRGFGNFTIVAADHFQATAPQLQLIQLPTRLIPFARWLMGQKNWIVQTLYSCYFEIGKYQAGFLLTMDPRNLLELPFTHLPSKLNLPYHMSTYYRLLQTRSVRIVTESRTRVFPIACLLPSASDISKYHWIRTFNEIMKDELASKTAVSDDDISVLIKGVARRTIAKHREAANIPARFERQKSYDEGRDTPYAIVLPIDPFLEKDFSETVGGLDTDP
jgi:hypothetical protein